MSSRGIAVGAVAALACACGAHSLRSGTAPEPEVRAATPSGTAPANAVSITGGTLAVTGDGRALIAADPDRDLVWIVDLDTMVPRAPVVLRPGDEPGRVAQDAGGHVHVALRRGGAIATIDPSSGAVLMRRPVCSAPRGLAYDEEEDALHVACTDGSLVTLGALERTPRRIARLPADLRDVVVHGDHLYVSRFRAASVLTLDRDARIVRTDGASAIDVDALERIEPVARPRRTFAPRVGWRLTSNRNELWMIHQRAADFPIDVQVNESPPPVRAAPYAGIASPALDRCPPGIVHSALSRFGGRERAVGTILPGAVLPVDVALSPDGLRIAMAFAEGSSAGAVFASTGAVLETECAEDRSHLSSVALGLHSNAVAVAWIDERHLAVQYRQRPAIVVYDPLTGGRPREALLGEPLARDGGHALFHRAAPAGLACASCHPEGEDDGHVWQLGCDADGEPCAGPRRTQTLGGGVLAGPLHWSGDLASLDALMDEVLVDRMGAMRPLEGDGAALARFLDALPPPPSATSRDARAIGHGRALFAELGCDDCHDGPRFTDEQTHDVGTGETLQTPTLLGLAARAPYFHDGRVATLEDRFGTGHTDAHGDVRGLDDHDVDDLVAYLTSL